MSSNNLAVFSFDAQEIRFVEGKAVANDVAKVLGYADTAATISKKVFPQNKGVVKLETPGGIQSVTVLEEAGIYQLIFSSKLPSAQKFQQWVFEEVLPAIRKTGNYAIAPQPVSLLDVLETQIKMLREQEARVNELETRIALEAQRNDVIEETIKQHDAELDRVFNPDGSYYTIRGYAKLQKMTLTLTEAKKYGKLASELSKENGFKVDKVKDPRYGEVNAYSEHILNQLNW